MSAAQLLPFAKMHGLGNDYVYVEATAAAAASVPLQLLARWVSDRHFGVGSDGLIVVARRGAGAISMRMFNADGSESGMCGNGVRCATRFAVEHGLAEVSPVDVVTPERSVSVTWRREAGGHVERASVDMGHPVLRCGEIPAVVPGVPADSSVVAHALSAEVRSRLGLTESWAEIAGVSANFTLVSMGNPHAVIFCERVDAVPLEVVGPLIETWEWFPARVNVHFVEPCSGGGEVLSRRVAHWKMRTWERGSGITQACGSGACAVCVAGVLEDRGDRRVQIDLPGGTLRVHWHDDGHVHMEGACTHVFDGVLNLRAFSEWRARADRVAAGVGA